MAQVIGLSGNAGHQGDLSHLHTFLKTQESFLSGHLPAVLHAVHALDPSLHSLGMLFLL